MAIRRIKIVAPIKLYDEGWSKGEQPEGTSPDALNVLSVSPYNNRIELSQREGCNLASYFDFTSGIMRPPVINIDPGGTSSSITVIPIPPETPVVITSAIVDDGNLPGDGSGGEVIVAPIPSGGGGGGDDSWDNGDGGGDGGGGGSGGTPVPIPIQKRRWKFCFTAVFNCFESEWSSVSSEGSPTLSTDSVGETPWNYVGYDGEDGGEIFVNYRKCITVDGGTAEAPPAVPSTPATPDFTPSCLFLCGDPSYPLIAELASTLPMSLTIEYHLTSSWPNQTATRTSGWIDYVYDTPGGSPTVGLGWSCIENKWALVMATAGDSITSFGSSDPYNPRGTYTFNVANYIVVR